MFSVTQRVRSITQPNKGYIPSEKFEEEQFFDCHSLFDVPSAVRSMQGTAVDYLTRLMIGESKENAL